jgi:hypothetical protein
VHWTRLTLRQELGVEMAMQHTAERVLEQAQPLVGDHDLGAESPVLAGRHLPQGWHLRERLRGFWAFTIV